MKAIPGVLIIASSLLWAISFFPFHTSFLQWFCLVPLFYLIDERGENSLKYAVAFAVSSCLFGFYWLFPAVHSFSELKYWISIPILIAFCLIHKLDFLAYLFIRQKLRNKTHWALFAILSALAYLMTEKLFTNIFQDTPGAAFYQDPFVRQLADLGGPTRITFFVILVNELILLRIKNNLKFTFVCFIPILLVYTYGAYRIHQQHDPIHSAQNEMTILSVQANDLGMYKALSDQAVKMNPKIDWVFWPELVAPKGYVNTSPDYRLAFGAKTLENGVTFNSIVFNEEPSQIYHKRILFPFFETVPILSLNDRVRSFYESQGWYGRGSGKKTLTLRNKAGSPFVILPGICYEDLFTEHFEEAQSTPIDLNVSFSDDSHFPSSILTELHRGLSQFRAVETRRPLLRVSNGGITSVIDELGNVTEQLIPNVPGTLVYTFKSH